jgi:NADPH:quinone reductase-like Zn-dependent oxidoreductase
MKAVTIESFGTPVDVVRCAEIPDPAPPGEGEVSVRMLMAPINPADMLTVNGSYVRQIEFPFILGTEGVGRVDDVGGGVEDLKPGDLVVPMPRYTWQQRMTVRPSHLIKVPTGGALEQMAQLKVNPATADRMLANFVTLEAGDWIIQNVANSGVGRYAIQLAKQRGVKTVNIVRRGEMIAPLEAIGGTVVLADSSDDPQRLAAAVREATEGAEIKLGLDAIAGTATDALAEALGDGGEIVNYGTLSRQPCQISGANLFQHDKVLRGFWLTAWYRRTKLGEIASVLEPLAQAIAAGDLFSEVDTIYPIEQAGEACTHAARYGRDGKILIALSPDI